MAQIVVTALTKARMLAIEAASIVAAAVDGAGNLTFTRYSGATIAAGNIKGPTGSTGATGATGPQGAPNPRLYSATSSSTQTLTSGIVTIITGWTYKEGDSSVVSSVSAGVITVAAAGLYDIKANISFGNNSTGRRIILIYKNGVEVKRMECAGAGPTTPEVTYSLLLAAGDTIDIRGNQISGGDLAMTGAFAGSHTITLVKHT